MQLFNSIKRISWAGLLIIIITVIFSKYGGYFWRPLYIKYRILEIAAKHPDLKERLFAQITLIIYKNPGIVKVFDKKVFLEEYKFTAASGITGPKLKSGDLQIPEGIYKVEYLNPYSNFHLSIKINYPNQDDIARSKKLGIINFGNDIFIHGSNVSVGCVAIGNYNIERLFYIIGNSNIDAAKIIIAPNENITFIESYDKYKDLYQKIYTEINQIN